MKQDTEKIAYDTEDEAREALQFIVSTCNRPWLLKDKKPSRVYYSEITQKFHLTSAPNVTIYHK